MLAHEITNHKISFVCTRESELAVESIARKDYKIVRQGDEELAETVLRLRPDLVVNDILNTSSAYMACEKNRERRCRPPTGARQRRGPPPASWLRQRLWPHARR